MNKLTAHELQDLQDYNLLGLLSYREASYKVESRRIFTDLNSQGIYSQNDVLVQLIDIILLDGFFTSTLKNADPHLKPRLHYPYFADLTGRYVIHNNWNYISA